MRSNIIILIITQEFQKCNDRYIFFIKNYENIYNYNEYFVTIIFYIFSIIYYYLIKYFYFETDHFIIKKMVKQWFIYSNKISNDSNEIMKMK